MQLQRLDQLSIASFADIALDDSAVCFIVKNIKVCYLQSTSE
jgi:hypothetical protein